MRLPLPTLVLCCLMPFVSLADAEPADEAQASAAEASASAAIAASTPAPAPAASSSASSQPTAAAAEADEDMTIVCKTERNVGTRFEKKTCRTRSAWQRIEKAAEEDFGAVRSRQMTCPDCRD